MAYLETNLYSSKVRVRKTTNDRVELACGPLAFVLTLDEAADLCRKITAALEQRDAGATS